MTAGLAARIAAQALMRMARAQGGFATVLARGDPNAGQLLLLMREKGRFFAILDRLMTVATEYQWQHSGPGESDDPALIDAYLDRRRASDPDLWVIELDVPDATQFTAQLAAIG